MYTFKKVYLFYRPNLYHAKICSEFYGKKAFQGAKIVKTKCEYTDIDVTL